MPHTVPITVLIPTRERCETLCHTLRSVTSQNYDQLSIIVSDNCSTDRTADVVSSERDPRVRYIRTRTRLSMSSNWEYGLSDVQAGLVTVLGDDDALLPRSIERIALLAAESGALAIRSTNCQYKWPSLTGSAFGELDVPLACGDRMVSSAKQLSKVMRGKAGYTTLPMIYTGGFLHASVLARLRSSTGSVFLSMTPDVYSGMAAAQLIDDYVYCDSPLAVNGASAASNGTSFFRTTGSMVPTEPSARYLAEANLPPHGCLGVLDASQVPKSIQSLLFEAYSQSLRLGRAPASWASPSTQLRLIRREAWLRGSDLGEWEMAFCAHHKLPLRQGFLETMIMRMESLAVKASRYFDRLSIWRVRGTKETPLANVADAAHFAGAVLASPPSRATAAFACVARNLRPRESLC